MYVRGCPGYIVDGESYSWVDNCESTAKEIYKGIDHNHLLKMFGSKPRKNIGGFYVFDDRADLDKFLEYLNSLPPLAHTYKGNWGKICNVQGHWWWQSDVSFDLKEKDWKKLGKKLLGYEPLTGGKFPYLRCAEDVAKLLTYLESDPKPAILPAATVAEFLTLISPDQDAARLVKAVFDQGVFSENMLELIQPLTPKQREWAAEHFQQLELTRKKYREFLALKPAELLTICDRLILEPEITLNAIDLIALKGQAETQEQRDWLKLNT